MGSVVDNVGHAVQAASGRGPVPDDAASGDGRDAAAHLCAIPVQVAIVVAIFVPIRLWLVPMPFAQIKAHIMEGVF